MQFQLPKISNEEKGPYTLVGEAHAKPGQADSLEGHLLSLVPLTREEPGCVAYHIHRDRANSDRFVFYEAWASKEALEQHLQQPYIQNFLAEHMKYLKAEMSVSWLEMRSIYK